MMCLGFKLCLLLLATLFQHIDSVYLDGLFGSDPSIQELELAKLFISIDQDNNYFITYDELYDFIDSAAVFKNAFLFFDINSDSQLAYNEIVYSYQQYNINLPNYFNMYYAQLPSSYATIIGSQTPLTSETSAELLANYLLYTCSPNNNNIYLTEFEYKKCHVDIEWNLFTSSSTDPLTINFIDFKTHFLTSPLILVGAIFRYQEMQSLNPQFVQALSQFNYALLSAKDKPTEILSIVDSNLVFTPRQFDSLFAGNSAPQTIRRLYTQVIITPGMQLLIETYKKDIVKLFNL
eukprot:117197_1